MYGPSSSPSPTPVRPSIPPLLPVFRFTPFIDDQIHSLHPTAKANSVAYLPLNAPCPVLRFHVVRISLPRIAVASKTQRIVVKVTNQLPTFRFRPTILFFHSSSCFYATLSFNVAVFIPASVCAHARVCARVPLSPNTNFIETIGITQSTCTSSMAPLRDLAQLQCPGMCGTCKSGGNPSIKTRDGSLHVLIPNKKHYTVNVEGAVSNLFCC